MPLNAVLLMENLKKRLVDFAREKYNMGQTRFEDYCGLAHGTISAIKEKGPTASVIMRIASACPELDLNWLFRGESTTEKTISASPSVLIENAQTVNIGNWGELVNLLKSNKV